MRKYILILLCILSAISANAQTSNTIEIPFTLDRNLMIIKASFGSLTNQNFIFDTGTEGIILMDSIANQFKVSGMDSVVTPEGQFVGLQEKVLLPKIEIAALTLLTKNAIKTPKEMIFSQNAIGIIGIQTFIGYTITFDYKNSKLILQEGGIIGHADVIPINLDHLLEAKVKLNNKLVLAHFDCGGAGYISIPKAWDTIYKLKKEAIFFTKGRTPMGDFDVFNAVLDGKIEIGNYLINNPKISLVTGDFFYAINFGYAFFKEHLISIDTKNKLMKIKS